MSERHIHVDLKAQRLQLMERGEVLKVYPVSTSRYGAGELIDSYKTPRGRHVVRVKVGAGQPSGTVFVGRRPTGEIFSAAFAREFPARDWILTRILWLSGIELGRNRLGKVDTMRRYIYIHGAPDIEAMGAPGSIGCVRMRNDDVTELFELIKPGTAVNIV